MGDGNALNTTDPMGKVGCRMGWKKKNVPDDFMVPLQIFPMCCFQGTGWLTFSPSIRLLYTRRIFTQFSDAHICAYSPVVVKMKILLLHKSIHPLLFLCFCFFYYLFYDCIKWPIVKVNDSQRHKIAHFLL